MKRWETWARLDVGDHGMGVQRDDPTRVGLVELTDALRWVPREGEDWSVPLRDVTVRTRKRRINRPADGVEVELPQLGVVRIRALAQRPGTPVPMQTAYQARAARSGQLLKELIARGAKYTPLD